MTRLCLPSASPFALLSMLALLGIGGCSSSEGEATGTAWLLENSTNSSLEDARVPDRPDTTVPPRRDVVPVPSDVGDTRDVSEPSDVASEDGTADAFDRDDVRRKGLYWYRSRNDEGWFHPSLESAGTRWPDDCTPFGSQVEPPKTWWLRGGERRKTFATYPTDARRGARLAAVSARGDLTRLGSYGPKGRATRRFDVSSFEVDTCRTFELFQSCLVPNRGDRCLENLEGPKGPNIQPEYELVQLFNQSKPNSYRLTVELGWDDVADGGSRLRMFFDVPRDFPQGRHRWNEVEVQRFSVRHESFVGVTTCTYDAERVRGWFNHVGELNRDGRSSFEISARATELESTEGPRADTNCTDAPVHVWGFVRLQRRDAD